MFTLSLHQLFLKINSEKIKLYKTNAKYKFLFQPEVVKYTSISAARFIGGKCLLREALNAELSNNSSDLNCYKTTQLYIRILHLKLTTHFILDFY